MIGIGETGLDFYRSTEHKSEQYQSFENHIEASIETKLPLIIHQRDSENKIIDIYITQLNCSRFWFIKS